MNIPRRIAALKREIQYFKSGIENIEKRRAEGEPTILVFPKLMDKMLSDINNAIAEHEAEIKRLEAVERSGQHS